LKKLPMLDKSFIMRKATGLDKDRIIQLAQFMVQNDPWLNYDAATIEHLDKEINKDMASDASHLVVCEREGQIIAYGKSIATEKNPVERISSGWISSVVVHPDFRRRDIGTRIVEELILFLEKKNVNEIRVMTRSANRPAHRLFKKFGFKNERVVMVLPCSSKTKDGK